MFKSVGLVVELNADLEQYVAEQVFVVVRLLHLGASLLGIRGDRQSRANIHFFLFRFFSHYAMWSRGWVCFLNKTIQLVAFVSH